MEVHEHCSAAQYRAPDSLDFELEAGMSIDVASPRNV